MKTLCCESPPGRRELNNDAGFQIGNMAVEVNIGNVVVTKNGDLLIASGIGSCLIITLYDPKYRIGALAHAMLPSSLSVVNPEPQDTKYVNVAIEEMLKRMEPQSAKREDLEAKLVGGANMFSSFASDIGKQNILSAKDKLKKEGITIVGECVGGSQGRSVEFSPTTGIVTVKIKF